mmetsp:Transcript_51309/g.159154  ORF Transcript_51309/g.159154 Transcript_51309/m.159154 type:complete len:293 (-) Transcript_51309:41-919(-)
MRRVLAGLCDSGLHGRAGGVHAAAPQTGRATPRQDRVPEPRPGGPQSQPPGARKVQAQHGHLADGGVWRAGALRGRLWVHPGSQRLEPHARRARCRGGLRRRRRAGRLPRDGAERGARGHAGPDPGARRPGRPPPEPGPLPGPVQAQPGVGAPRGCTRGQEPRRDSGHGVCRDLGGHYPTGRPEVRPALLLPAAGSARSPDWLARGRPERQQRRGPGLAGGAVGLCGASGQDLGALLQGTSAGRLPLFHARLRARAPRREDPGLLHQRGECSRGAVHARHGRRLGTIRLDCL